MILLLAVPVMGQEINKPYETKAPKIEVLTTTASHSMARYEMGRIIVDAWRKLGLDTELNPMDYKAGVQRTYKEKNFDTYIIHHAATPVRIDPDIFMYGDLHSSTAGKEGRNLDGWINKEYDALMDASRRELNMEKRKQIIWKAQKILFDHQPENILINDDLFFGYNYKNFKNPIISIGNPITEIWSNLSFTPVGKRKVLKVGYPNDAKKMNPVGIEESPDYRYMSHIYDSLIRIGPEGEVKNWAAKEIKPISDTVVDVVMRKNMHFHDGKPVTVEDVKFTFDYLKKWKSPFFLTYIRPIKEVKIMSDDVVRFELEYPLAPFIYNTLGQVLILPKHIWKDVPEKVGISDPAFWENPKPIGSGPFKFDYWKRGEALKLVKNSAHFHPPKVEGIIWVFYGSNDTVVGAAEKGEIDVTGFYIEKHLAERLLQTGVIKIPESTNFGFYTIHYNTRKPPFNDMHFRRALSFAIPRTQIKDVVYGGKGKLVGSIIAPANKFWNNPNLLPFSEDINLAKKELKEAGYTWDKDGKLCYPRKENDQRTFDSGPGL